MNFIEEAPKWNLQAAFYMAIKNNSVDGLETLLNNYHVDVDTKFGVHEQPAITLAVESGHTDVVKCLLSHSCSVNQTDSNGETPLHRAVINKRLDLMRLLLPERAKCDVKNKTVGATPFHLAVDCGRLEVLQTLASLAIDKDEGVRRSDNRGYTPLLSACSKGLDSFVHHLIVECNACVRVRDDQFGNGPLHYVLNLNQFTLELLVNHGANCNMKNFAGLTPLHIVAMAAKQIRPENEPEMYNKIKYLVAHGANLDAREKMFHRTPLHLAVMFGNVWCAKVFAKLNANVESKDRQGRSVVYYAAKTNDINLIKVLLSFSGAKLHTERWICNPTQADDDILPDTLEFLRNYKLHLPHSLQYLVRSSLRHIIDDQQIRQLAIPTQLIFYLLLNEF